MQKKQKILLLDNYDSYTFNIAQILEKKDSIEFEIIKNDKIKLEEVNYFDKIILSPGPDIPSKAGKMQLLIKEFYDKKPIFGICLGMQAIAIFFGAKLYNLPQVYHGIREKIYITQESEIFNTFEKQFYGGLYHSWAVEKNSVNSPLKITALSKNDIIMGIEHKYLPVYGVQFHPESYITQNGNLIIENFIKI